MNLLQLVQQATREMGLPVPTAVASNTATDTQQQMGLLNAAGMELVREHQWELLDKEYRFTTLSQTLTGTTVNNSAVVTGLSSTTGLDTTYMVTGTGIGADASILTVDSSSQVTLNQICVGSGTNSLTFGKVKYTMPSDYDRQIDSTNYDKSRRWQMIGPLTAQQWQNIKSSWIASAPLVRYRILAGFFQIWPLVSTGDVLGFEYMSNLWVTATTSTTGPNQVLFQADTDTCVFPDRLMILALKLKYFEVKGFDTSSFLQSYVLELNRAKTADAGSPTLSMAPRLSSRLIGWDNIPDSLYGQS